MRRVRVGEPPLEALVDLWVPRRISLSPKGDWVAWEASPASLDESGPQSAIWLANPAHPHSARRLRPGYLDSLPRWAPNGRSMALLSQRGSPGVTRLHVLPNPDQKPRAVTRNLHSITDFKWSPDSRKIAYIATGGSDANEPEGGSSDTGEDIRTSQLYLLDVRQRIGALGEPLPEPSLVSPWLRNVVDFAWAPDGTRLAVATHPSSERDDALRASICIIDVQEGAVHEVGEAYNPGDLLWSGHDGQIYWVGASEPRWQTAYVTWTASPDGGSGCRIFRPERADFACTAEIVLDPATQAVVEGFRHGLSSSVVVAIDAVESSPNHSVQRLEGELHRFDYASGTLAAIAAIDGQPARVLAGPLGSMQPISTHTAALARLRMPTTETFSFRGPTGESLEAVVVRPPSSNTTKGTVVLAHGGPYSRVTPGGHPFAMQPAAYLAMHGYTVLMPNYRGSSGRGRTFARVLRGCAGDADWADLLAAVDSAIERGIADPTRLTLGGWSYGGYLAAWGATQTDRFRAVVVGAGITDWRSLIQTTDFPSNQSELSGLTGDGGGRHRFRGHSPLDHADKVKTPVLIVHGGQDTRIPPSQALEFHSRLQRLGLKSELHVYPDEGHAIRRRENQVDLMKKWLSWYERHL